jgi:SAM-dependent methyltransferase
LPAASRVLEIGSGDGRLAQALASAGHEVIAIDRDPKPGLPILATSFEDFDAEDRRFNCIVAGLVLHHVADLEACLQKICTLLQSGGFLAVDDYGWERLDDDIVQRRWGTGWRTEATSWRADRKHLHQSITMLELLRRYCTVSLYYNHPYFDDGDFDDGLAFTFLGPTQSRPFSFLSPKNWV